MRICTTWNAEQKSLFYPCVCKWHQHEGLTHDYRWLHNWGLVWPGWTSANCLKSRAVQPTWHLHISLSGNFKSMGCLLLKWDSVFLQIQVLSGKGNLSLKLDTKEIWIAFATSGFSFLPFFRHSLTIFLFVHCSVLFMFFHQSSLRTL